MKHEQINILLFLAQAFEDLEAVTILDAFGWTHYRAHLPTVTVTTAGFHEVVRSRFGLEIRPDLLCSEINPENYDAFVLPGGFYDRGFDEAHDPRIHRLAREIHLNSGYIATMCVGVLPIAEAGLLREKEATIYPHSRKRRNMKILNKGDVNVVRKHVVMDDRIISSDGPGSSLEVAFLLMECLIGPEKAQEVRDYMVYEGNWNR
jgi:4-methyl-5(b-hydroxyethyl)-thiazole monophosphate biosynthesis